MAYLTCKGYKHGFKSLCIYLGIIFTRLPSYSSQIVCVDRFPFLNDFMSYKGGLLFKLSPFSSHSENVNIYLTGLNNHNLQLSHERIKFKLSGVNLTN